MESAHGHSSALEMPSILVRFRFLTALTVRKGGGNADVDSPLPNSTQALDAWSRFVTATVQRYGAVVTAWEVAIAFV